MELGQKIWNNDNAAPHINHEDKNLPKPSKFHYQNAFRKVYLSPKYYMA